MKAIIYTRVSTEEQGEKGFSLGDQKIKLERYCYEKGIEIVAHFKEEHSAKTFERPEFKKLLEYAVKNKGKVDKLLVIKYDRFSRNLEGALGMITSLGKLGIE